MAAGISVALLFHQTPTTAASAGTPAPGRPVVFEVASIRAVPESKRGYFTIDPMDGPRFRVKNMSLTLLLAYAYDIDGRYISGLPKGAEDAVFDIDAEAEGEVRLDYEHIQEPLQALLRDRFHATAHRKLNI